MWRICAFDTANWTKSEFVTLLGKDNSRSLRNAAAYHSVLYTKIPCRLHTTKTRQDFLSRGGVLERNISTLSGVVYRNGRPLPVQDNGIPSTPNKAWKVKHFLYKTEYPTPIEDSQCQATNIYKLEHIHKRLRAAGTFYQEIQRENSITAKHYELFPNPRSSPCLWRPPRSPKCQR